MNMRILLVLLSCAASIVTGLVLARGGAQVDAGARTRPLIGLSMDTLKEERWMVDRDLFLAKAKELGADVMVLSANSIDSQQVTDVQSLITSKVDAMVIIPHDGAAMAKGVRMAQEAGIPVISYDRLITGCDLDIYLTFDNVKVGELQAKFLADRIPANGKLRVIRIYGSTTDNNAKLFKQGQDNVLLPLIAQGKVEVVHEDWAADWKPENAKKIASAAITKVKHGFDAILASNDGTAGGAIQALTEEGLDGKILVTGQDADLAACQRIARGTQTMTVYKPIKQLANAAAELAVKMALGRPVVARATTDNGHTQVPSVLLEIVAVTKDNLRETVVADGFRPEGAVYQEAPE
jgi:D-xylose transport system substrate-binding protein